MIKITCPPQKKFSDLPRVVISGTGISAAEKAGREFIKAVLRDEAEKIDREFMEDMK